MHRVKLMYKIHGMSTANGMCRSAGNDIFYRTLDGALRAARSYVVAPGSHDAMVIYKAHVLVRESHPPVEVLSIEHDGEMARF